MPRFYPNIQFSDCWSSVGDITYYHRNGICYFRSKAYTEFKGTSEQMVRLGLHRRAIRAWQGLDHATQMVWRSLSKNVVVHRPPFDNRNHISGYNLFVSAYHGFAQLGHEHVPEPQAFLPFPIFNLDFGGSGAVGDSDILLQTRLTLYGTEEYSRYRVLGKIQSRRPAMVEILARCGSSFRCQSLLGRSAMLLSSSRTTGMSGVLTSMPIRFIYGTSCSIPQPDTGLNTTLCRHW